MDLLSVKDPVINMIGCMGEVRWGEPWRLFAKLLLVLVIYKVIVWLLPFPLCASCPFDFNFTNTLMNVKFFALYL